MKLELRLYFLNAWRVKGKERAGRRKEEGGGKERQGGGKEGKDFP